MSDLAQRLTLRDAFTRFYEPELRATGAARETVSMYRGALNHWERVTEDPPLASIGNETLADFRDRCLAEGLRPPTVNKLWRAIRAVLRRVGPQQYRNPAGLGLIDRIPHLRQLPEPRAWPRIATLEELDLLYEACSSGTWPECEIPAAGWWRAALVLFYNCGLRCRDLFELKTADVDLAGRRLRFVARKTGLAQLLPLNETAAGHLASIWAGRVPLFPRAGSVRPLRSQWARLQKSAGIAPRLTFQDLRKTCGSAYFQVPGVGGLETSAYVLGHRLPGVTGQYYVNPSQRIIDAADQLAQPASFDQVPRRAIRTDPQRTDWAFESGRATYRGKSFDLAPRPLACLRAFVAAGRPIGFDQLERVVFWDRPGVSRTTIKTTVRRLREKLAIALDGFPSWDPLPWRPEAGGWELNLF